MPNEIDDILTSQQNIVGYSAWVLQRSGVAVHSTLDAIAETLNVTAEARIGYSAWILQPSGINIPSIDEVILGVPETEETVTCIGTAIHTLEEVIVGTPAPEPTPVPVPAVGGASYAPIFEQEDHFVDIEETLDSFAVARFEVVEITTYEETLVSPTYHVNSMMARYRKPLFTAYPVLPDVDLPPKEYFRDTRFPDELPTGLLSDKRKKMQQQMLLLDLF